MSSNIHRALLTVPLHAQRSYLILSSRPTLNRPTTASTTRKRSTWGRAVISNTPKHNKHCGWLNARDGNLQQFRDPTCDGCLAEGSDFFKVMSSSTLSWYKKMQQLRTRGLTEDQALTTWVESDPYSVLFGNSERRLRGLSPLMPLLVRQSMPDVSERLERQRAEYLKQRESPSHPRSIFKTEAQKTAAQMAWQPRTEDSTGSPSTQARLSRANPSPTDSASIASGARIFHQPPPAHGSVVASAVPAGDIRQDMTMTKDKLERSYANIRKETKTLSKDIKKVTTNDSPAETLGKAWRTDQASRSATSSNKPLPEQHSIPIKSETIFDSTRTTLESAWTNEKQHPRLPTQQSMGQMLSGIPHFVGRSVQPRSAEAQMTYMSILTKDKPLRHMRGYELGMHRARLLASWAAKSDQQVPNERPKVQVQLDEEVANQKRAFKAFEGKWRLRDQVQSEEPSKAFVPASQPVSENKELAAEKEEGKALVREVREIYESAYGVINAKHRQGDRQTTTQAKQIWPSKPVLSAQPVTSSASATQQFGASIGSAFDEYESRTGGYSFKGGQDQLEKEVKNKGVSDQMWTAMDPALSRQKGPSSKEPARFAADAAPEPAKAVARQEVPAKEQQSPPSASTATPAPAPAERSEEQSTKPASTAVTAQLVTNEYGLLAYDPDSQIVAFMAISEAPAADETVIPVPEALSRLKHPAKFLHCLSRLPQDKPFDVITAKDDLLVVKFMRHGQVDWTKITTASLPSDKTAVINPVDGTGAPQSAGNSSDTVRAFESTRALADHMAGRDVKSVIMFKTEAERRQVPHIAKSSRIVRKQEPVFSGRALRSKSRAWTEEENALLEKAVARGRRSRNEWSEADKAQLENIVARGHRSRSEWSDSDKAQLENIVSGGRSSSKWTEAEKAQLENSVLGGRSSSKWSEAEKAQLDAIAANGRSAKDIAAYLQTLRASEGASTPEVMRCTSRERKVSGLAREVFRSNRSILSLRRELDSMKAAWSTSELENMIAARKTASPQAEATSSPSTAELVEASRFPSSFLHSTRTYMPQRSSIGGSTSGIGSSGPTSGAEGRDGSDDSHQRRRRRGLKRKAVAVASVVGFVYAVGIVVENLRDKDLEFRWSTTPGSSPPSAPTRAAAPSVSPSPPPPQTPAPMSYTRTAWLDDHRSPVSPRTRPSSPSPLPPPPVPSPSPFAATLTTPTPASAGFEPEDGGSFALRDEMRADGAMHALQEEWGQAQKRRKQQEGEREQQEELEALEAAFAAGAGVAVAVGVLLGGFGGGS